MHNIFILKTSDYMDDGIHCTNIGKEFITKSFSFAGTFNKTRNIYKLDYRGQYLCGFTSSVRILKRSSGTVITPTLGSIVQNGKFAASALALDRALNNVDLPTFGRPTIPH
jgi:hypothetical protein